MTASRQADNASFPNSTSMESVQHPSENSVDQSVIFGRRTPELLSRVLIRFSP